MGAGAVFPDNSVGKESDCNAGDLGLIPELGRFTGEGIGYPLQYSGLENSMDCSPQGHKGQDGATFIFTFRISFRTVWYCFAVCLSENFYLSF